MRYTCPFFSWRVNESDSAPTMSQVFHVVRCFRCQTFQVKKVPRWSCRMCGEKQSLLKEFGRGSGADCRHHVQKLNAERGAALEHPAPSPWSMEEDEHEQVKHADAQVSHWSRYLDSPVQQAEDAAVESGANRKRTSHSHSPDRGGEKQPPGGQTRSLLPLSSMFDTGDDFSLDL
ncbi:MRN complex-interacting protein isoform X2 [Synchiropus splendidus]|uniref:MRN complex-interacting protein isoform X2 n=1 Tax=Synchiropus splendidus TaxID=270530 RepID=UPI00237DF19C|nr:MRN complex-interacting protein isoform X2 [Synchiropus splendidus]